jgi:hypothetical protein
LHGVGGRPDYLVGRRLERVVASWRMYGTDASLDVWLIDGTEVAIHVTAGSDG